MSEVVSRYCPKCAARVKAAKEAFCKPQKCPKCGNIVTFHDYTNDPVRASSESPELPPPTDWFDTTIYVCFALIPILAGLGAIALLAGNFDVLEILAVAGLLASCIVGVKFGQVNVQSRNNKQKLDSIISTHFSLQQELVVSHEKRNGFKINFDRLVQDRYDLLADHAEKEGKRIAKKDLHAQKKLDIANERNNTIDRLGRRLLGDTVKWVSSKMTPNNFTTSSDRLRRVVEFCRKHEYEVASSYEEELLDNLREEFEGVLRKQHAKDEQARIKARIRDEQRAEKELERELRRIESEKDAIQKALDAALQKSDDEHSEEIELLRDKLAEAEERSTRAMSMAQQTKAGNVYVISNIGSFGEGVYKIGMTRRLDPMDRVKELGDASVPFPFDVHMMISCDDAPALENAMHKALNNLRLNKINRRREYFRTNLEDIVSLVEDNHGEVEYIAEPEALQYRESLAMPDEDFAYISDKMGELSFGDEDVFPDD